MSDLLDKIGKIAEEWCAEHYDRDVVSSLLTVDDLDDETRASQPTGERFALHFTAQPGWDGTPFSNGIRSRQRDTPDYDRPLVARGLGYDFGRLEQLARTSPQWQRVIENADNLILSSKLEYDLAPKCAQRYPEAASLQRDLVQQRLSQFRGGLRGYLRETTASLMTAGWSVHVVVDALDGGVEQLAARRPSTVRRWLLDEQETSLLGIEFVGRWGEYYSLPVEHTLITSWRPFGLDLEGVPPIRTAAPWIVAKQMIAQLWHARIKKYATPVVLLEAGEVSDTSDDERFISIWSHFTADDYPVITLKRDQKVATVDLHATPSEFESALRYCDEQILLPLSNEGALLGLNRVGAYALASSKEGSEIAQSIAIVQRAIDTINGVDHTPWSGLVQRVTDSALDGPFLPDDYPTVRLSIGEDDVPLADVLSVIAAGIVPLTDDIRAHVAQRVHLPIPAAESATTGEVPL